MVHDAGSRQIEGSGILKAVNLMKTLSARHDAGPDNVTHPKTEVPVKLLVFLLDMTMLPAKTKWNTHST